MKKILEYPHWYLQFLELPPEDRMRVVNQVMSDLREVSHEGEGGKDRSLGERLAREIRRDYDLIGVTGYFRYVIAETDEFRDSLDREYHHPFGSPTLVLKHKKLPFLMLVNPAIRFNETFLNEMPMNPRHPRQGGAAG